jgi:hypothetical protein
MSHRYTSVGLLLLALAFGIVVPDRDARAETVTTHPFRGVTLHQRTETSPRTMKVNVLEIDLRAPGIRFSVTPPNGHLPGETTLQTTRDFLIAQHAQLAINASFYKIIAKRYGDSEGYIASEGKIYSGPSTRPSGSPSLNISRDHVATILDHPRGGPEPWAGELFNAVSGNERIIRQGKNIATDARLHPRMAAGVADDGHRLVIVEIDGRQPRISEGATTIDIANILLQYGGTDAINLDGGGSATVAIADPSPRLLNTPVGVRDIPGSQRKNACNVAIFAERERGTGYPPVSSKNATK